MQNQDNDQTIVDFQEDGLVFLIISKGGKIYNVSPKITIGRNSANDVVIPSQKISRNHAEIEVLSSRLILKDLGSSNGTFVNGQKIRKTVEIKKGDVIKFDKSEFTVEISTPREYESTETVIDPEFISKQETPSDSNAVQPDINTSEQTPKIAEMPASWVEESAAIGGTRMMNLDQLRALRSKDDQISLSSSNVTTLHCFIKGQNEQIFELPVLDINKTSGWEIGRNTDSDIVLDHPSVSGKHAQIIHQNGRWKIVNLVSTNGILINGQKKLSAFLSDGDKIILGSTSLVFKMPLENKSITNRYDDEGSDFAKIVKPILLVGLLATIAYLTYYLIDKL
jgi:pSer/pThr/pTyr-binding forkhead associated (FHA) protein